MKAGLGMSLDGTEPVMEFPVSSFKLRKFSSEIVRDTAAETEEQRAFPYTPSFYSWKGNYTYAVMKDGTKIGLWYDNNSSAIDLTQVDYVLLPDGTKLPVPEQ